MVPIEIDMSDTQNLLSAMRVGMTQQQFTNAMHGILRRSEGHIRKTLSKNVCANYAVTATAVRNTVKHGHITAVFSGVGMEIPVEGPRLSIGGTGRTGFKSRKNDSAAGWESLWKKYRVHAKIFKSHWSTLPAKMDSGFPPFRNSTAPKLNNLTYFRYTKKRKPIIKVVSIAIPQMPLNKARPGFEKDLELYFNNRIRERFKSWVLKGR